MSGGVHRRSWAGWAAKASGVAVVLALVTVLVPPALAGSGRVFVASKGCTGRVYRPGSIVIACADAGLVARSVRYSSYGGSTARAQATFAENDCQPNCAAGHFHTYSGTLTLTAIRRCSGVRYYTKVAYRFSGPAGKGSTSLTPAKCLRAKPL
jgi:hypothetical protein